MRTDINVLHTEWVTASAERKDPLRDELGEALYRYIKLVIRQQFPKWSRYLLIDNDGLGESAHNIFAGIEKFDAAKGTFAQWSYGVTCNACIDILRQRHGRNEVQYCGYENIVPSDGHFAKLYLRNLREQLTEEENELIDSKLLGGLSEELAQQLGTTGGYLRVKWKRLKEKIRTLSGGNEDN